MDSVINIGPDVNEFDNNRVGVRLDYLDMGIYIISVVNRDFFVTKKFLKL